MKNIKVILRILFIGLLVNTAFASDLIVRFYPVSTETKEPVKIKYFDLESSSMVPLKPSGCNMIGALVLKPSAWSKVLDPYSKLVYKQTTIPNAVPVDVCSVEVSNASLPPQTTVCSGKMDPSKDVVIKYSSGQCSIS